MLLTPPLRARGALLIASLALSACSVPIAVGLDDRSANQAMVALERSGVAVDKERDPDSEGHWRLSVSRDDASGAVAILAQESLPAAHPPGVLESMGQGSVVPSRLAEQAKLVAGIGGDLERSLGALDGVVSARVHLAVTSHDVLAPDEHETPPSASVLLRHRGPTPPLTPSEIQKLVAGAVPGLDPSRVAVVTVSAPPLQKLAEHELSRFGPLTVTRGSVSALRLMVIVAVSLNLLLLGALIALWARLRRAETTLLDTRDAEPVAQSPR